MTENTDVGTKEIQYVGSVLTATTIQDRGRIVAAINEMVEIYNKSIGPCSECDELRTLKAGLGLHYCEIDWRWVPDAEKLRKGCPKRVQIVTHSDVEDAG